METIPGQANSYPLHQTALLHNLPADHNISFIADFRVHNWAMGETCCGPTLL
jgi:hypothetical protein